MPTTALLHFTEDIARASAILAHADQRPQATPAERRLRSDLLRSSWMFAVGSLDAYFCDAYTDIIAAAESGVSENSHFHKNVATRHSISPNATTKGGSLPGIFGGATIHAPPKGS